jgi:hypothetical protein
MIVLNRADKSTISVFVIADSSAKFFTKGTIKTNDRYPLSINHAASFHER